LDNKLFIHVSQKRTKVILLLEFSLNFSSSNTPNEKKTVRCSAIEGILHRYHSCGPMLMLEEVAHDWHLGYLGALGLLGAIGYLGAIGLLSLHVDVWRLIFLKLSLPRDGVRGCSAPCNSILYVHSFFKNGTDLTIVVILQVICACLLLQKDATILISVGIVVVDT
jgi:hypothetical protein